MNTETVSAMLEIAAQIGRLAEGTFMIAFAIFSGLLWGGFKK